MKELKQLFVKLRILSGCKEIERIQPKRWMQKFSCVSFQSLRFTHERKYSFEGPGFKYFLQNENIKLPEIEKGLEFSHPPYVNELYLNGNGQKVYIEVYGCQMNVSDTEIVLSVLQKSGYQRTTDLNNADVVLIVTCSIRDSSEIGIRGRLQELNAYKIKTKKKHLKIGILGCMAERLKTRLLEISKSVDIIAGPDSYRDLPRLLAVTQNDQKGVNVLLSLDETYADIIPVRLNQNDVTAYVSIMRGCDNMCTYCIVPFTRGKERSRPIDSILEEVKRLSDQGVKQITLLGQNVNSYRDISSINYSCSTEVTKMAPGFKTVYKTKVGGIRFLTLLDKVSEINPDMRIRFTSPHPKDFPIEVLHLIRERKNICCSLHLPAQSGSNAVLERMRRGYTREAYIQLVETIRSVLPDIGLTTDIITGFCGETEDDHKETLDLLRLIQYNFTYFFMYSMREKTTAHRRYVDDVPREEKTRRLIEIRDTCRNSSKMLNEAQINQIQLILIEGVSKRSKNDLAGRNDKNTKVIIPNISIPTEINSTETASIKPGDYVAVVVKEASSQVLKGVPLYHSSLSKYDESKC